MLTITVNDKGTTVGVNGTTQQITEDMLQAIGAVYNSLAEDLVSQLMFRIVVTEAVRDKAYWDAAEGTEGREIPKPEDADDENKEVEE